MKRTVLMLGALIAATVVTSAQNDDRASGIEGAKARNLALFNDGLKASKITLINAVERVQRACPGDVLGAELEVAREKAGARSCYKVVVLQNGEFHTLKVDGETGNVTDPTGKITLDGKDMTTDRRSVSDRERADRERLDRERMDRERLVKKTDEPGRDGQNGVTVGHDKSGVDRTGVRTDRDRDIARTNDDERWKDSQTQVLGFEDNESGRLVKGWRATSSGDLDGASRWRVTEIENAPKGKHVLRLSETKTSGEQCNLLLTDSAYPADGKMSVRLHADSGKEDQGGALIFRARDDQNYYSACFNPMTKKVQVHKVVNGQRTLLGSKDVPDVEAQRWYTLCADAQGDTIKVKLDDKHVLTVEDSTYTEGGKVGICTKADAATSFDDFCICTDKQKQ